MIYFSGFGDFIIRKKHVGCVELLNSVTKRIKPKYVISGHIHEGKFSLIHVEKLKSRISLPSICKPGADFSIEI